MIDVTFTQETMEYILLILVRITSFVYIAPFFGQSNTPARVKLGFSVFVSILIFYSMPESNVQYGNVLEYSALIIEESITGLLIGFSAYICNMILMFSGKIIDMEIGLSMAQVFDPTTKTSTSITGTMYQYFVFFLMVISNMHIYLLNAIVDSFKLIPIGGINVNIGLYNSMVGFITDYFIIGFRIVLPVFASILLLNCILGIMAKVAPQMNMFAVGMQLKVITGLFVMFITISLLPSISNFIFNKMQSMVTEVMKGMM